MIKKQKVVLRGTGMTNKMYVGTVKVYIPSDNQIEMPSAPLT